MNTLRTRLSVLVLIAVAPGFWLLHGLAANEREDHRQAAVTALRAAAREAREQQQTSMEGARGLLASFAETQPVQEHLGAECSALAARLLANDARFANIGAITSDGTMYCIGTGKPPFDVADRQYFLRAREAQTFIAGVYQVGRASKRPVFNYANVAWAVGGGLRAVVWASFDLDAMQRRLGALDAPKGSVVFLTDRLGTVIAGTSGRGEAIFQPLWELMQHPERPAEPLSGSDGVLRHWAFETVDLSPGDVAMRIAMGVPEAFVLADSQRLYVKTLLLYGLAGVAALAAISLAGELLIVRRLAAVARAAGRLAEGDYGARTELAPARDEVGQLAGAFDGMAASLEALTRQHRMVLHAAGEGIVAVDAERRITFANPAAERLLGIAPGSGMGRSIHDFAPHGPADKSSPACAVCRAIESGKDQMGDDVLRREGGATLAVQRVAAPIREAGALVGAVLTFEDATERQQLEAQLRHAQKMEAVGRLASGVAHDFNNLLVVILGGCDFLLEELPQSGPLRDEAEGVRQAGHRAARLVSQLLTFARKSPGRPVRTDLNAVVLGIERLVRRSLGKDVDVSLALTADPWPVCVDPGQLDQVILNLAVNARDAMAGGGRLRIETANGDSAASAGGAGEPPSRSALLRVSDTGCGMSPEVLSRIFEPFFTTKEQGKGTGLGLSTVFGIVQQANGEVIVQSEPGKGSTFTVRLPVCEGNGGDEAVPESSGAVQGPAATVLAVED
ncbi:MAG TPA: ATP-binding protein [Anaeromyxobacter sp.]